MPADNGDAGGAGAPQGLSWSYEMDFGALIAAITGADPPDPDAPSAGPRSAGPPDAVPSSAARPPQARLLRLRLPSASPLRLRPRIRRILPRRRPGRLLRFRLPPASLRLRPAGLRCPRSAAGSPAPARSPAPGSAEEEAAQEAILDDLAELDARAAAEGRADGGRVPLAAVAGRVAERLAPGPDLAAWLAAAPPAGLGDGDLAAVAGSWRRVASWAQARELAAVAQITPAPRPATRTPPLAPDGCPSVVTRSAAAQVALELTMSPYGASAWADLAVQLGWRLAGDRRGAGRRDH